MSFVKYVEGTSCCCATRPSELSWRVRSVAEGSLTDFSAHYSDPVFKLICQQRATEEKKRMLRASGVLQAQGHTVIVGEQKNPVCFKS